MTRRTKAFCSAALVMAAGLILVPFYIGYQNRYQSAADIHQRAYLNELEDYRAYIRADPNRNATGDGVPARYRSIYEHSFGSGHLEMAKTELPFDRITLERTGCYGPCPIYKVTFFRSGTAELEAGALAPFKGRYEGQLRADRFARLCFALERLGFASFKANYNAPWTDDATCIVTVSTKNSSKSVSDYGQFGPIELWTIQCLLDRVREEVQWKPVRAPDPMPESIGVPPN